MKYLVYCDGKLADSAETEREAFECAAQLCGSIEIFMRVGSMEKWA